MSGIGSDHIGARFRPARFFGPELRVWRGLAPLWTVFWGYGVVASLAIVVLFLTAYDLSELAFQQVLIVVSALYTVWVLVGIWRCASNADPLWRDMARLLTVAWALNTALVLVFLQIDFLMHCMQG